MTAPPPRRSVRVPIRIVVRGRAFGEPLSDLVAERAGAQLGRAFDVLDEQGDWQPVLQPLDVRFTGRAEQLSQGDRRALHAQVIRGLTGSTRVAQARRGGGSRKAARRPSDTPKAKPRVILRPVATWAELDLADGAAFHASFRDAAQTWMRHQGLTRLPATYAILFRQKGNPELQLWVVDGDRYVHRRGLRAVTWEPKQPSTKPAEVSADATELYLEHVPDGLAQWREGAYRSAERDLARAEGLIGKVTAEQDVSAPGARHRARARAAVDAFTAGWETKYRVYYRLKIGAGGILQPFSSPTMPTQPRIPVIPIVDRAEAVAGDQDQAGALGGGPELPEDGGDGGDAGGGGRGAADAGKGAGSDVTAPPGQNIGAGSRGVVIAPEYKVGGPIFPSVPSAPDARSDELDCEPYKDEPSVDALPTGGPEMKRLIAEIAARLDMKPCPWPAHFCIQASRMIRIRASQVQRRFMLDTTGEFTAELSVGTLDEAGGFRFRAMDSVAVQYLQHLAATMPRIRSLIELVRIHTYPVTRFGPHHWFEDVMHEATQAAGLIWLAANQIMMQQLLNSSRHAVMQRKGNAEYTRVFAAVCRSHLADQVEMIMLRTALETFQAIVGDRKGAVAYEHARTHLSLQLALSAAGTGLVDDRKAALLADAGLETSLVSRLSDETDYVFLRGRREGVADAGAIVEAQAGGWVIRASDGQLYSKADLDRLIQIREQVVASIDPLIHQLLHRLVSAIRPLVEAPDRIPSFLDDLFTRMLAKNDEVSRKNTNDLTYAFEHGQIHRADRSAPPAVQIAQTQVSGWALQGIHALAHAHVGVHFKNDPFYTLAVDRLIGQEYYWRSFVEDLIFIFGIGLTIICPPLGAAVSFVGSLALGISAYAKASEQETIHGALVNPEQVLSYAEIQIDLFLAKLGLALSFLELVPGAGKGVKALAGLGKTAVRQGARRGVRAIAREVVMEELERLARISAEDFAKALVLELAEEAIEDKIVDALVSPIIEDHIRQLERELHEEGLL